MASIENSSSKRSLEPVIDKVEKSENFEKAGFNSASYQPGQN